MRADYAHGDPFDDDLAAGRAAGFECREIECIACNDIDIAPDQ